MMRVFSGKQMGGFGECGPAIGIAILSLLLSACGTQSVQQEVSAPTRPGTAAPIPTTAATVACTRPAASTLSLTEGPYFKSGSPERSVLIGAGMKGTRLILSGSVLTADCQPVLGARLDFWQANADGQYDNSGYTLRGHQFSDADGHYRLTTIVPGLYTGRTEHIHVKVAAPGGPVLTTQLFFPGVAQNQSDGIFAPSLVMDLQSTPDGDTATFNFVISLR
jgi:protocatechuate 3,4-dioxygenase beta subunit